MQGLGGRAAGFRAQDMSGNGPDGGPGSNGITAILAPGMSGNYLPPVGGIYEIAVQGCGGAGYSGGGGAIGTGGIVVHKVRLRRDQPIPYAVGDGTTGNSGIGQGGVTSVALPDVTLVATSGWSDNYGGADGVGTGGNVYNGSGAYGPYLVGANGIDGRMSAGQVPSGKGLALGITGAGKGGGGRIIFTKLSD
jgi:hypothetical protein